MAADDLMKIRITADFKEAEGAFLKMAKVATAFESDFRRIAGGLNKEFNRINGMAQLFGDTTNVVKDKMNALKRAMDQLMATGLQAMNPEVQKLKKQYDELAASITHTTQETTKVAKTTKDAGNSVKKSNLQWTHLALVVQDLPYGFRGIQNNLPALIGGFAGMTGAIYLAGSVIIAFFTALDNGMIKFGNTLTSVELKQKAFNDVLDKSKDSYTEAKTQVMLLNDQVAEAAGKKDLERKAVKDYNDTIGESLGKLKTFKEVQSSLIDQGDKYIDYIFKLNMANTAASKVAEESANMLIASFKTPLDFVNNIDKLFAVQFNMFGDLAAAATGTAKKLYESGKENQQEAIQGFGKSAVAAEEVMKIFRQQAKEAKKLLSFGTFDDNKGGKQKDNYLLDSLKAQQQAYKDDIYAFRAYGILIINEEERLAVARATEDGTYLKNKKEITDRYQADRIANDNLFENNLNTILETNAKKRTAIEEKEFKRNQQSIQDNIDFETKIYRDSNRVWDQIQKEKSDAQVKYTKDYINKLNEQLRVELKLHKNNVLLQQEDVKNKIDQLKFLQFFAAGNVKATELINSAILKLTGTMAGFGDVSAKISTVLGDTLQSAFEGIGETIGQLIATGKFDFSILGNILADALIQIGKALIMYSALVKAAKEALEKGKFKAGLVVGVLAIAAGVALKASLNKKRDSGVKEFANGGVISGPTMGLMGEYPGARSNPEVVAPLDKLKGLIGGNNGGTLEARISGNDLLILMNKAQRNNNTTF
jgi:hypothetical protein